MTVSRPLAAVDRSRCPAAKHGTSWYRYKDGCTCPDARVATQRYEKLHRAGVLPPGYVPIVGTSRRLQALGAIGYGCPELSVACGAPKRQLAMWRGAGHPSIHRRNADMIGVLFDRLSGRPGPSERARRHAARQGWASALLWDGLDIDDPTARPAVGVRTVGPARPRVCLDDVAHLRRFGVPEGDIAARLRVDVESIAVAERRARSRGRAA